MEKEYLFRYKENVCRLRVKVKSHVIVVTAHSYESARKNAERHIPHGAWLFGKGFVEYKKRER